VGVGGLGGGLVVDLLVLTMIRQCRPGGDVCPVEPVCEGYLEE